MNFWNQLRTFVASKTGTSANRRARRFCAPLESLESRDMLTAVLGLSVNQELVAFDTNDPTVVAKTAIGGLGASESLVGIDYRPSTGELYGVSNQSKLYIIDPSTGAATIVGQPAQGHRLRGTEFGVAFDPDSDRLRVTSDADRNFRLHASRGVITGNGTRLRYAGDDANEDLDPNIVALAFAPDPQSNHDRDDDDDDHDEEHDDDDLRADLFGIDSNLDVLVRVGASGSGLSANAGKLFTIGALGADTEGQAGFTVASDGVAYAALRGAGDAFSRLYSIDLATGHATAIGQIGGDALISLGSAPATIAASDASTDAEHYVDEAYSDILGRHADHDGMAFWAHRLGHGLSRSQFVTALQDSGESHDRIVRGAYLSLLGRNVDESSRIYWHDFLSRGGTAQQVDVAILASDEYFSVRAGGIADDFVDTLYRDVLGRDPDSAGQAFFAGSMGAGQARMQIVRTLFNSEESLGKRAAALFDWYIGREADDAGEQHFVHLMQHGATPEQVIVLLVASDEYYRA